MSVEQSAAAYGLWEALVKKWPWMSWHVDEYERDDGMFDLAVFFEHRAVPSKDDVDALLSAYRHMLWSRTNPFNPSTKKPNGRVPPLGG